MKKRTSHNNKPITLYVTDLDGTLLDRHGKISAFSADMLNNLGEAGAYVTACTARTPATVVPIFDGINTRAPLAVMTGAALWDRENLVYRDVSFISQSDVIAAYDILKLNSIFPFVYTLIDDNAFYCDNKPSLQVYNSSKQLNDLEEAFYLERKNLPLKNFNLGQNLPAGLLNRCMLFFAIGKDDKIARVVTALSKNTGCTISCYPDISNPGWSLLELLPSRVNKALAVKKLRKLTGADKVVAFGDNLNDLDMLAEADIAVAVGNAEERVKEAADIVIGSNDDDSVAKFIMADYFAREQQ